MILKQKNIGVLEITSGMVDIMDPGYDQADWFSLLGVSVKSGNYIARSYYGDFGDWGKRVAILQIVHEDYLRAATDKAPWELIGSVGVDTGMMSFCESPKPDFNCEEWSKFCDATDGPRNRLGKIVVQKKPIAVSSSGIGDGCYPVFALKEDGETIALEARFTEHPML